MDLKDITHKIDGREVVIVDREVFQHLLSSQRQDVRKKFCTLREALIILGVSEKTFRAKLLVDTKTKIQTSSVSGKYLLESINREADRLAR